MVADFDGDGKRDLAVADPGSNKVNVLLGNGNGTFQAKQRLRRGKLVQGVAMADFNVYGPAGEVKQRTQGNFRWRAAERNNDSERVSGFFSKGGNSSEPWWYSNILSANRRLGIPVGASV